MVRRVVTGHDEKGRSVILSDGAPPVVREIDADRTSFYEIWSTDDSPAPVAADEPEPTERALRVSPSPYGTKVRIVEFEPGAASPMHRTQSVDYGIVLEGEMHLVLDGSETRVEAGTVVVQRGTVHAWQNRSDKVARMIFILVAGGFTEELKALLPADVLSSLMD